MAKPSVAPLGLGGGGGYADGGEYGGGGYCGDCEEGLAHGSGPGGEPGLPDASQPDPVCSAAGGAGAGGGGRGGGG
jgi:hypothetical protein